MHLLSLLLLVVFSGSVSGIPVVDALGAFKQTLRNLLGRPITVPEEHPPTLLTFFGEHTNPESTSHAPVTSTGSRTGIEKKIAKVVPSTAGKPVSIPLHFPSDRYEFIKQLGRGYYGQVYLVREKSSSQILALKSIKGYMNQANHEYSFLKDPVVDLAIAGSKPFRHYGVSFIPMKHVAGKQWLSIDHELTRDQRSKLINRGIAKLKSFHQAGIIHGDPALRNIMVDLEKMDVVFVDFGLASRVHKLLYSQKQRENTFRRDIRMFLDEFY